MVVSVTYYLELHCAITFYYLVFLSKKVDLVVWTLYNINMFTW